MAIVFISGLIAGGTLGVLLMAMIQAGKHEEE
jgi:hypothetical protein